MKPRAGPIQDITDNAGASGGVGLSCMTTKGCRVPHSAISTFKRHKGAVRNITAALADAKSVSGTPR
jgi:hypothetical protein